MDTHQIRLFIRKYLHDHCKAAHDWSQISGDAMLTHPRIGLVARDLVFLIYKLEETYSIRFTESDLASYGASTIDLLAEKTYRLMETK